MEPLAGHEINSENGEPFMHAGPLHRTSNWFSVSPGEMDPSMITDFLQDATKNQEHEKLLPPPPPPEHCLVAKIPSLDANLGIPEVRKTLAAKSKTNLPYLWTRMSRPV